MTIDIAIRGIVASGVVEVVVLKAERQPAVPTLGTGLPPQATITTDGLQKSARTYQPGRVIFFGQMATAPEQPRTMKIPAKWGKYKMAKIRQGDFYLVLINNRSGSTIIYDVQSRFREQE